MKKRIDDLMLEQGFADNMEKARAVIMSGIVYGDNRRLDKPGELVDPSVKIDVRSNATKFVSRGGLKLEKAIVDFSILIKDKICMDIGASTGGFTDCMLKAGAKKVYSIDVGYGQLAWGLRTDNRVINLERTNARHLTSEIIDEKIDFAGIDVSFISLSMILPAVYPLLQDEGKMVCLIKPQFEAAKFEVEAGGVVRDRETHCIIIQKVLKFAKSNGFATLKISFSPIKGPRGNIEYLLYLKKSEELFDISDQEIHEIVAQSHVALNNERGESD